MAERFIHFLIALANTIGPFTPPAIVEQEYSLEFLTDDDVEDDDEALAQYAEKNAREGASYCREYICILIWFLIDCFKNECVSAWYNSVGQLSHDHMSTLYSFSLVVHMKNFDSIEFEKQLSKLFFKCLKFLWCPENTFEWSSPVMFRVANILSRCKYLFQHDHYLCQKTIVSGMMVC